MAFEHLAQHLKNLHTGTRWGHQYREAQTLEERWAIIRAAYAVMMPQILTASARHLRGRIDPYFLPWDFTPIEAIAWERIRTIGTPLYPQVPVDRFLVDFANPYYKIGLELDGADYHDPQKDRERDLLLMRQGWYIYRITGAEAHASTRITTEDEADWQWFMETSDGIITALDYVWFRENPERWDHYEAAQYCLAWHNPVARRERKDPHFEALAYWRPRASHEEDAEDVHWVEEEDVEDD